MAESLQARLDAMVKAGIQHHLCPNAYKAISPERWTNGGIYQSLYAVALNLLRQLDERGEALAERDARIASLESTIRWALGEGEDFPDRPEKVEGKTHPLFWWRTELRARAALKGGQP